MGGSGLAGSGFACVCLCVLTRWAPCCCHPPERRSCLLKVAEELWVRALVVTPVKIWNSHVITVEGGVGETCRRISLVS